MKLRFNEGAIVTFELVDGTSVSGKVIKVYDDEVELINQLKIVENDMGKYCSDRTLDGKEVRHVNRQLIKSWKYAKALRFSEGVPKDKKDFFSGADYSKSKVNMYEADGTCKGNGKWCGDIEEHYATNLIIPNADKAYNGFTRER